MSVIELRNVTKSYGEHVVIKDLNYVFEENTITSLIGESGSGKTTVLNMIGLIDSPTEGEGLIHNENIKPFSKNARLYLRNNLGYLFQNFALVDDKTVLYNMKIAINEKYTKEHEKLIGNALIKVGLEGYQNKLVSECSGGEQQRVAIARLLIKKCDIVLADEPTGSLDDKNKFEVLNLITELKRLGKTIIIVTHDDDVAKISDNVLYIEKL